MVYDYLVKHNGIIYEPGMNVPGSDTTVKQKEVAEPKKVEGTVANLYKKTEIMRMSNDNLKALATRLGIEYTDETSGNQLKKEILAKLGI